MRHTAVPEMNLVDVVMKRRNAIFLLASTSHPSCFVVHTIVARRALDLANAKLVRTRETGKVAQDLFKAAEAARNEENKKPPK
jgi:hypothetical protein